MLLNAFVNVSSSVDEVFYCGDHANAVTVRQGRGRRPLDSRGDLRKHSSDGFTWGDGRDGQAQLSLALLADALQDDQRALDLYQEFATRVVTTFPDRWIISRARVRAHADRIDQRCFAMH